jgi:hypothetical protein
LKALYSKSEIDGLFAKYGIKDVYWRWNPEANDVYVMFKIEEEIEGVQVHASAKVEAYPIWNHRTRKKAEEIDWNVTMRQMHWFIKTHLQAAYVRQTSKVAAFLGYIQTDSGESLKDVIIPRLEKLSQFALENQEEKRQAEKVITLEKEASK